jgi:protein-L-isoaspartate(D-aspartate) O-methyltransferase
MDMYDDKQAERYRLVSTIERKGIHNEQVLEAIANVPRHLFFESALAHHAYQDKAFPIGAGQTISQPYTVAFQTQALQATEGMKVLEVGTGSGYQACILAELGLEVHTIERQHELYEKTRSFLPKIGYADVNFYYGDGYKGLPAEAPFDRILITAGAPELPAGLLEQLKTRGCLVAPIGKGGAQLMVRVEKKGPGEYERENFGYFSFVPMLPGTEH